MLALQIVMDRHCIGPNLSPMFHRISERIVNPLDLIILETLRAMQTNRSQSYKTNLDAMSAQLASLKITNVSRAFFHTLKIADLGDLFGNEGTSLGNAVKKTVRIEATRRVVVTAIALKRFELKHGKLPENIAGLAPEILAAVPIDPFAGQPLRYRPNGNGTFLLYCVGEDGVDNGGDASQPTGASTYSSYGWQNPRALDWVWPQPATAAEIEIYYEEQAKKAR